MVKGIATGTYISSYRIVYDVFRQDALVCAKCLAFRQFMCVFTLFIYLNANLPMPSVLVFTTVVSTDHAVSLEFVHGTNQY